MRSILEAIFSDHSLKPLELAAVKPRRSNSYLAADSDQSKAKANTQALRLARDPDDVTERIRSLMLDDLGAEERHSEFGLLFIDRTPLMRYPDGLYAWIDRFQEETRVALFSCSVFGRRDFGVNAKRVQYLLQELKKS